MASCGPLHLAWKKKKVLKHKDDLHFWGHNLSTFIRMSWSMKTISVYRPAPLLMMGGTVCRAGITVICYAQAQNRWQLFTVSLNHRIQNWWPFFMGSLIQYNFSHLGGGGGGGRFCGDGVGLHNFEWELHITCKLDCISKPDWGPIWNNLVGCRFRNQYVKRSCLCLVLDLKNIYHNSYKGLK